MIVYFQTLEPRNRRGRDENPGNIRIKFPKKPGNEIQRRIWMRTLGVRANFLLLSFTNRGLTALDRNPISSLEKTSLQLISHSMNLSEALDFMIGESRVVWSVVAHIILCMDNWEVIPTCVDRKAKFACQWDQLSIPLSHFNAFNSAKYYPRTHPHLILAWPRNADQYESGN